MIRVLQHDWIDAGYFLHWVGEGRCHCNCFLSQEIDYLFSFLFLKSRLIGFSGPM